MYYFKRKENSPKKFSAFHRPLGFLRKIRGGYIAIEEAKLVKENLNQT